MGKFRKSFTVHSYETNQFGQASLVAVFNYMLEIAWAHAQVLEWGYEHLKGSNLFWVLSKIFIDIENLPNWKDTITIETWSKGTDGIYAYRDFIIYNEKNEVLIKASSSWLILDLQTRRIFRLAKYIDNFPFLESEKEFRNPEKLKVFSHKDDLTYRAVTYSELDINKHFNSARYVERVMDDFTLNFHDKKKLSEIEINYLKEAIAGDSLAIDRISFSDNDYISSVVRKSDQADLCLIRTAWKNK